MAAKLLRIVPLIRQEPVRAAASKLSTGWSTARASMEPTSFPRAPNAEYYHTFHSISLPCRNRRSTTTVKVFRTIRGLAFTAKNQHPNSYSTHQKPAAPTATTSNDSPSDADFTNAQASKAEAANYTATLRTDAQSAIASISALDKEMSWIKATLRDPGVQLTPEARARNKSKLAKLEEAYRSWGAKAAWWDTAVYSKEPKQVKRFSDIYARVKVVKEALETDAESEKPVWTPPERAAMGKAHEGWEAETRKEDKWYKRIAWGPSILITAAWNIIF
ncbi:MAG: hypothetical protein Q9208_007360 [Pyrenodesmia sp. 3 TL-2023]